MIGPFRDRAPHRVGRRILRRLAERRKGLIERRDRERESPIKRPPGDRGR
jgi:hypothetical protein